MTSLALDRRAVLRGSGFMLLAAAGILPARTTLAGSQNLVRGLAIGGYDAVGYFDANDAVLGDPRYALEWNGATWHFASAANRDRFAADPHAYAPQYDGYCAYAAAFSSKANGDPEVWEIVDGKLYLNLSDRIKRRWQQDIPGFIARADAAWPGVNP